MTKLSVLALTASLALVVFLVYLLRSRRIREKYVVLWIVLAVGVLVLSVFPQAAFTISDLVGIQTPSNLVLASAVFVLLMVCIHLSVAVSHLEEAQRRLVEESAILRLELEKQAQHAPTSKDGSAILQLELEKQAQHGPPSKDEDASVEL